MFVVVINEKSQGKDERQVLSAPQGVKENTMKRLGKV